MTNEEKALEIKRDDPCCVWNAGCPNVYHAAMKMAEWKDEQFKQSSPWKDAQSDDLPEIDKEVIVLCDDGHGGYKVCFGHRPYKKGYLGKSLVTGNIETYYPKTYGKGEWNIPDVKWWLDVSIPNLEEQ